MGGLSSPLDRPESLPCVATTVFSEQCVVSTCPLVLTRSTTPGIIASMLSERGPCELVLSREKKGEKMRGLRFQGSFSRFGGTGIPRRSFFLSNPMAKQCWDRVLG
jgi:hypothetical protein